MKILIVTQWFDPEPTFKGMMFAEELQRLGHDVTVLTGFPNYPGGKLYPGYRVRLWQHETRSNIKILRVPLYPDHSKSVLARTANYASFAISSGLASIALRRPDIVYCYHPPGTAALAPLLLRWLKSAPYVLDVQDLWPDTLGATGLVNNRQVLTLLGRAMRVIYHFSSHVIVLSPGFKRLLSERGVPSDKLTVIPNWTYPPGELDTGLSTQFEQPKTEAFFEVLFAGNMGPAQNLSTVIDAAALLSRELPYVRLTLVGSGIDIEFLKQRAASKGVTNVRFLPRRRPEEMAPLFDSSDVLLVHLKDDPLFAITIPSKTQAYLQAGKPILMAVRGDAADMIADAGVGYGVEPENPRALADAILRIEACSSEEREEMGRNGRLFYAKHLALSVGTERFAEVFESARYSAQRGFGLKRFADLVCASALLLFALAPLAIVALLVGLKLGRPILFRQERPGLFGKPFQILKFRTMTDARGASGALLSDRERLTRFGSLLRMTSLDELPALMNVIRGEMSLVGPRPLLVRYTPFFTNEEMIRLVVRPGITGWAQVNGRNRARWDERLQMDVWYVRNWSLWLDVKILIRTIKKVFVGGGIVVDAESVMQNLDDERRSEGSRE